MASKLISVIGALDYDLVMIANRVPDGGESLMANEYFEALGGKGANAAMATHRTCHQKPKELVAQGTEYHEPQKTNIVVTESELNPEHNGQEPEHKEPEHKEPEPKEPEPKEPEGNNPKEASIKTDQVVEVKGEPAGQDPSSEKAVDLIDIEVRMVGAVGDDRYGERFLKELEKNGVNVGGIRVIKGERSSTCFVIVENFTRENRCLFTLGATATWKKEDFMAAEQLGNGVKPDLVVAQMEINSEVVEQMIETAGKAGVDFCLNAAPANPITNRTYRYITHLLVNESEAAVMSGRELEEVHKETWPKIAQEFLDRGVKNVVITLGANGAFYATATEKEHVPAFKVDVVDSTGAG
jgi:ribokinase